MSLHRREFLQASGLAACSALFPMNWVKAQEGRTKKILMFTRSVGFQHDVVNRDKPDRKRFLGVKGELAHAEFLVTEWGKKHGFEVTCTKDGRVFIPEELAKYDAFFFYTQGDLCSEKCQDGSPPMTPDGKKAFLDAIASGKGYIGTHCASDTFHSKGDPGQNQKPKDRDPYIQMLGGEFIVHGEQFKAKMVVTTKTFPAVHGLEDFDLLEEWYSLKNFAPDIHVILAEDNSDATAIWKKSGNPKRVEGNAYHIRPRHPATWARKHEKGRVFYSSMGHREDVWTNETFQKVLLGGIAWALGNVDAEIPPNLSEVAPHADVLKQPA
jgi:type 1 glutamine amidotransferase